MIPLLLGCISIWGICRIAYATKDRRRLDVLYRQLADSFESMTQAIRAGSTFVQALHVTCQHIENPLADHFRTLIDQYHLGIPMEEGLARLARATRLHELWALHAAYRLSLTSGGSLATMLEQLTQGIREREQLRLRIHTISAQGRMQGFVMVLLPYILLAILWFFDGESMERYFLSYTGFSILCGIFCAQVMATFCVQKIVDVPC